MIKRTHFLGLALVLLLVAPVIAVAQPPFESGDGPDFFDADFALEKHARGRHGRGLRGLLPPPGYLDLSDEQTEAVQGLFESMRGELEPLREQSHELRQQVGEALESTNPDATAIGQLVIDTKALRDQKSAIIESHVDQFEALLTPEQLEKWEHFREIRDQRRERRHSRRDRGTT